jgi:UDP:flavonoid glycosyltransferase YjiC (YdhE family)
MGKGSMRVLMTCQPAFSHANQFIPLARELEQRGHQVLVATSPTFAADLERYGPKARGFGPDWLVRPGDPVFDRTVGQQAFFGFPHVPDAAAIDELLRLAADFKPDLIVREYAEFAGWTVARRRGVPLVTQGIIHRLPPPAEDRVVELVGRIAGLAGVEPPGNRDDMLGVALLDVVPPLFRCPWEHDASVAHPSRPSAFDGAVPGDSPDWLKTFGRERPGLYVTLGTIFTEFPSAWRAVMSALSTVDADAVVTTGSTDPGSLGAVSANVRIERYIPQSHVLPLCSAVVCHAGFGTMIGAFSHGLPAVCLPLAADQPVNASRCAEAGAGINAANAPAVDPRGPLVDPDTLDSDELAAHIRSVLTDPAFRSAARQLGDEIEAMPGPDHAATLLEEWALLARGVTT